MIEMRKKVIEDDVEVNEGGDGRSAKIYGRWCSLWPLKLAFMCLFVSIE